MAGHIGDEESPPWIETKMLPSHARIAPGFETRPPT